MNVEIGLLMFAAGNYVLLAEENGALKIPSKALPDKKDGLSVVYEIIKECSGVTGKWVEMTPLQVGVFDDVDRNPAQRELLIAYAIYLPSTMKVYEDYQWVKINNLNNFNLYLDTEEIIKYSVLGGKHVY